jgi:hypothetical protein
MPQHRFEIVGRALDRFTWRLVEPRGSRRLVLARTDQDYSTLQKVEEAIAEFQVIVKDAKVVNTTLPGETSVHRLPTSFKFVKGVASLVVEKSPDEDDELAESPAAAQAAQAAKPAADQPAAAQAAKPAADQPAAAQAAQAAKPAADQPAAAQAAKPAADQPAQSTRRSRPRGGTKASDTTRERTAPSSGSRRKT